MTSIREELDCKLNNLSPEQLDSVRQFVESMEHQQPPANTEQPLTNEDIDRIVESYRQQNKQRLTVIEQYFCSLDNNYTVDQ